MRPIEIKPLPAFRDNYIWVLYQPDGEYAVVVDPGDAAPVMQFLRQNRLTLTAIFITHRHHDHIGGILTLCEAYPEVTVYGPATEPIAGVRTKLMEGDWVSLSKHGFALDFRIIDVPGHTAGHIAYYADLNTPAAVPVLFCGDTLFAAGCGRLFDGTAEQLHDSLSKLARLPANTAIYCTHEYTLANLRFAKQVEPENRRMQEREQAVIRLREHNQPSLPSNLQEELQTNPFLRVACDNVKRNVERHAGRPLPDALQVFTEMRRWKDNF